VLFSVETPGISQIACSYLAYFPFPNIRLAGNSKNIMNNRLKIKVIKKSDLKVTPAAEISEEKQEQDNASQMSSTVGGWINEYQDRRREERETAIEQFRS
jgi:hypothetical protein